MERHTYTLMDKLAKSPDLGSGVLQVRVLLRVLTFKFKIMSDTGRYYMTMEGRTFCIEPIDNTQGKGRRGFGDINPATKKSRR